jgi:hypothetical protein
MTLIGAHPARLETVEPEVLTALRPLADDASDYSSALAAFNAAPNDGPKPALEDLSSRVDEVGMQWQSFGTSLSAFASALRAVDASGAANLGKVTVTGEQSTEVLSRVAARLDRPFASEAEIDAHAEQIRRAWEGDAEAREEVGKLGDHSGSALLAVLARTQGSAGLASNLARRVVHGTRWAVEFDRVVRYRMEFYRPPRFQGSMARTDAVRRAQRSRILTPFRQAHTTRLDAKRAFMGNRPLTRVGQRLASNPALKWGGRALGGAGVAFSGYQTVDAIQRGDTEAAVTSGLATAGGAMMLTPFPPVQLAGLALTAGTMIYSNWDDISDAAVTVKNKVTDVGETVVEGIGDGLSSAADTVGGWFD